MSPEDAAEREACGGCPHCPGDDAVIVSRQRVGHRVSKLEQVSLGAWEQLFDSLNSSGVLADTNDQVCKAFGRVCEEAHVKTRAECARELHPLIRSAHGESFADRVTVNITGSVETFIRLMTDFINAPED